MHITTALIYQTNKKSGANFSVGIISQQGLHVIHKIFVTFQFMSKRNMAAEDEHNLNIIPKQTYSQLRDLSPRIYNVTYIIRQKTDFNIF